ncbi:GNVR domain-containing protein [Balneolales bacterium ANBcel1]|nr:GNVR domain-containing protein [Balneolales bacterium ANBcel1]
MSQETHKETNLLDVLIVLARHKFFIIKLVFSITLLALIISLVWPHTYKSSSVFIPATQQRSLPGGIGGLLGSSMQLPMDFPQVNSEVILNILNSRELREQVIQEFNFQEIYGSTLMEELLLKIDQDIQVNENREGGFGFNPIFSIGLSFSSEEPTLSYRVNRFILEQLNRKIQEVNSENAREHLAILEERYLRNLSELEEAEDTLRAFQQKYGILEVEEQAKQIIEQIGELKAGSIQTEMQISVLRETVSDDNPELRNLIRTKEEFDRQFERLIRQSDQLAAEVPGNYPLLDLPDLGLNYLRLFREVEIQAKLLEALYPQYDSQKMVAQASRRGIQVIDPPVIPTYKDSPKRAYIVLGGMFFSIFLALTIVFFRNMIENGRQYNTENYRKLQELAGHMRFRKGSRPNNAASSDNDS